MMNNNPIDRLFNALKAGDVAAARACFTPGARVWHSFDCLPQDLDAATQEWHALVAHSAERAVEDIRRQATDTGFVQQHVFVLRTPAGERKAWAVCVVVRIEGDRIARLDEYIDRAGSFTPPEGPVKAPGF